MIVALTVVTACGESAKRDGRASESPAKKTSVTKTSAPSWLFVVRGASGSFERRDGSWRLTLHGADPSVLAFTDRPARKVRRDVLASFVSNWPIAFRSSAPNAAIVLDDSSGASDMVVVTLGDPQLDGHGSLTFPATPLATPGVEWAQRIGRGADRRIPAHFGAASLFVDADQGFRSVEVDVTNDSLGNLSVQASSLGVNVTWIPGETPGPGYPVEQYNASMWGAETNDINSNATAQILLTGQGAFPLTIVMSNMSDGTSSVNVIDNDALHGIVNQVDTGEVNHTAFSIQLVSAGA